MARPSVINSKPLTFTKTSRSRHSRTVSAARIVNLSVGALEQLLDAAHADAQFAGNLALRPALEPEHAERRLRPRRQLGERRLDLAQPLARDTGWVETQS